MCAKSRLTFLVATGLWLSAIAVGLAVIFQYETSPGTSAIPPRNWPAACGFERSFSTPTLVMAAHPHCPCTGASLGELAALMTECQGRLRSYVDLLKPASVDGDWEQTAL